MNDATVLPAHGRLSPNLKPAGFYERPHVCNCSLRHVAAIPVMARFPPKRQERRIIENTAATAIIMAAPLITVPKLSRPPRRCHPGLLGMRVSWKPSCQGRRAPPPLQRRVKARGITLIVAFPQKNQGII
jgi:hypothetical protein